MIQVDENDKKNAGMVTQQLNNQLNLGNKLKKMEKLDGNNNNNNNLDLNIGPVKTEANNTGTSINTLKILPKLKGNNTMYNFSKKNVNTTGNENRNAIANSMTENGGGQIDINDGIDEGENEKPKITKIVKKNIE